MLAIRDFTKKADEFIFYLDDIGANKYLKKLSREDLDFIRLDEERAVALQALQFLILPFLSLREASELINKQLYLCFNIEDLEITERIKKMLTLSDVSERDKIKEELKKSLVGSQWEITRPIEVGSSKTLKSVSDWFTDFLSKVDPGKNLALKRAQYMHQGYLNALDENERLMLKKLFDLYFYLNASSLTPEGFEDDLLMKTIDGKMVTTDKGRVVVLYDPEIGGNTVPQKPKIRTVAELPKTHDEALSQLEQMAGQYPEGSLERRALEEERRQYQLRYEKINKK
jgi:hypothetical protein